MKEIIARLIILEILILIVGAVIGPTFYSTMLCGMALLPLFLAIIGQ